MEDERVRSVIWNYFDGRKINDTIFGFCKIGKCSQKISCPTSSTTGLFTHLRIYQKKESAECDKKAQEAKRMKKEENKAGKQLSVSVTDLWAKKTAWTSDHEKAKEITRAIGRMLASDYLPYDIVEGQGFQALMIINNLELKLELDRIFCNLDRTRSKIKNLISHSSSLNPILNK